MASKTVTVLLSAMDLDDTSILKKLNIRGRSIIIDQCSEDSEEYREEEDCLFIKTRERGLSKSRNMAMRKASARGDEICIFCDNDVVYRDDYEEAISAAFERNPGSDIIVFFIERPERHEPVLQNEGPLDMLHSMKIFSPEIAFRLSRIRKAGLRMDELFGAGAKYGMGEENIFLFDARKAGLNITYVPERLAGTAENESTWFKGYDKEFFRNRGAGYYRMSKGLFLPLCLQYAVRKRKLYGETTGFFDAVRSMMIGKKEYLREKRYFLVGDYVTGTGPANATRSLLRAMPCNTLCQMRRSKVFRAIEIIRKIGMSDAAVFSGHSRQNILGMKYARKKRCPSVYIMHGAVEYENSINRVPDEGMAADEREMMKLADLILAVSGRFEEWLKEHYPQYKDKIGHLTNGVEWDRIYVNQAGSDDVRSYVNQIDKDAQNYVNQTGDAPLTYVNQTESIQLLSVGGGMPRKRINKLCEAVKILRDREGLDLTLHVAGAEGADSDEIRSYDFVRDHGVINRDLMEELYRESRIFIQNSIFETFGLAPVEALAAGCDIILSEACGVLEIFKDVREEDIINDPEDPEEIAEKIVGILNKGNNERLLDSTDTESTCWEKRAEELCRILEKMKK